MNSLQDEAIRTTLAGDWQKAISLNKNLIEENPEDVSAYNRLAFALNILGKTKHAKTAYQKVLELDPLNQIALRNIKKLGSSIGKSTTFADGKFNLLNNTFLEETGKTKIVELVNIAPSQITDFLRHGETLILSIKRLKIFVLTQEKKFIGMLPDDIAIRLIKFINSGNVYEAYIKSCSGAYIVIFIRELKRASRFKDQPSFLLISEKTLTITKAKKPKPEVDDYESEEEEEEVAS